MKSHENNAPSIAEGYVKYHNQHNLGPSPVTELSVENAAQGLAFIELEALRTRLHDQGLIGQYPNGISFGNVSLRLDASFLISATASGAARELGPDGYSRVLSYSFAENSVTSCGPLPPSSEALTHAAIYEGSENVRCVVHIHSPELFDSLQAKGCRSTPPSAAFGTVPLAQALLALVKANPVEGICISLGHPEGIIFYGPSVGVVDSLLRLVISTTPSPCPKKAEGQGAPSSLQEIRLSRPIV